MVDQATAKWPSDGESVKEHQISFVLVARDEPSPLLEVTVQGLLQTSAGYAREIVVVDDGSRVPVFLGWPEVCVVRKPEPVGTAKAAGTALRLLPAMC